MRWRWSRPAVQAVVVLALAVPAACARHRGHFTLAAAHGVPGRYAVVHPHVVGRGCDLSGPALERAVEDALAKVPAADLLGRVRVSLQDGCYVVEGAALQTRLPGAP